MKGTFRFRVLLPFLLVGATFASPTEAETGPDLILRPWGGNARAQLQADIEIYLDGMVRNGPDINLRRYELTSRFRFGPKDAQRPPARGPKAKAEPSLGLDSFFIDLDTSASQLPSRLVETRIAFAFHVGKLDEWAIDVIVGAGHASDEPFSDGKGWFGIASVVGRLHVKGRTSWIAGINYDGNRTIFPDLPLPFVAYEHYVGKNLRFSVGLPFNSLTWNPAPRWTIEVRGVPPVSLNGGVTFAATDQLDIFLRYNSRTEGFHIDGTSSKRRLFLQQRRVEIGVTWKPQRGLRVTVAGGAAFDQRFTFGFDVRNDDTTVARLDNSGFIRIQIVFEF